MRIETGQRFRDVRLTAFKLPCRTVWVVDRVLRGLEGVQHALLVDENDPVRRKTISAAALRDRKYYVPVSESRRSLFWSDAVAARYWLSFNKAAGGNYIPELRR